MIATPARPARPRSRSQPLVVVSALCAAAASLFLLVAPGYESVSHATRVGPGGQRLEVVSRSRATLAEVSGPGVYAVLAAPVLVATLPLLARRRPLRRLAALGGATLLGGFVVLTGFSVGLFYAPSALAMGLAALGEALGGTGGTGGTGEAA